MEKAINKMCRYLPKGWKIDLCMEKGIAWIDLHSAKGRKIIFPFDIADSTLVEQLDKVLYLAQKVAAKEI